MPLNMRNESSCSCDFYNFVVPLFFLLVITSHAHIDVGDVGCLKTIKESLEDPFEYLKASWDFNNHTEGSICRFTGIECWHPDENRVLNIRLAGMGLGGQFPRGLENCTSLTGLDLSSNRLFGPIPSDISKIIHFATSLDLSSNNFSGKIPPTLANCSRLNVLKLDHNQLTGNIPREIGNLRRLRTFSVANNLLTGPVPSFVFANFSAESYENNSCLCGSPLEPCRRSPTFFDSVKHGFLVGYSVFVVLVFTIFSSSHIASKFALSNFLRQQRKRKIPHHVSSRTYGPLNDLPNGYNIEMGYYSFRDSSDTYIRNKLLNHLISRYPNLALIEAWFCSQTSTLLKLTSRMSYTDVCEATNNFCVENLIGSGPKGMTYKATLSNGCVIAIKRFFRTSQFEDHFLTELNTLGRFRHQNLVRLLCFCIEPMERLLAYNYMPNGTLYDSLHGNQPGLLTWHLRVKIAIGIARGLLWLHQSCNPRIVHLDICTKCILLDRDFEPKLSNFWEAVVLRSDHDTDSSTSFHSGTELWESSLVKEDVYRFGILLLELITGEDSAKVTHFSELRILISGLESGLEFCYNNLDQWVTSLSETPDFRDIVDRSLLEQGFDCDIFQMLGVAYDCADPLQDQRPTMIQVYRTIGGIAQRCGLEAGDYCRKPELEKEEI